MNDVWFYISSSRNMYYLEVDGLRESHLTKIEALQLSITKWKIVKHVAEYLGARTRSFVEGANDTCALCHKYHAITGRWYCEDCPAFEYTRIPGCLNTPYEKWCIRRDARSATEEVEFLTHLLEKELEKDE